jgi:hypothetical protein
MPMHTWLLKRLDVWTSAAIEAVHSATSDRRPSRRQLLLCVLYLIRCQWAARGRRVQYGEGALPAQQAEVNLGVALIRCFDEMLTSETVTDKQIRAHCTDAVNVDFPCSNNPSAKAAEVREALDDCAQVGTSLRGALKELYRRGAFHHDHDVAYAAIALARGSRTVDEIIIDFARDYAGIDHRCDPVYPPS